MALKHAEGYRICRALSDPDKGTHVVIPDFREPNNIRLGITPLYTSFEEIFLALSQLKEIMEKKTYEQYPNSRAQVT